MAEVPETPACGEVVDAQVRVLVAAEAAPRRVQANRLQVAARADAEPVLEAAAPLARAGADPPAQLEPARRRIRSLERQIDRSLSTVDHRSRSIRHMLGVRSTARLVHALSERLEQLGRRRDPRP
jgi:hypothetical protein